MPVEVWEHLSWRLDFGLRVLRRQRWRLRAPGWEGSPLGFVPCVHGTSQLCFSNAIQMKAGRGNPILLWIALNCREKFFLWILSSGCLVVEWHTVSFSWSICLSLAWLSFSIARHDRFLLLILLVLALEQKFSLGKTFRYVKLSRRRCLWIPKHGLICLDFLDYSWAMYSHLSESCSLFLRTCNCVPAPCFPSGCHSSSGSSIKHHNVLTASWGSWGGRGQSPCLHPWAHPATGAPAHPARGAGEPPSASPGHLEVTSLSL